MPTLPGPLARPDWVRRHSDDAALRLLDCRWTLGVGARGDRYHAGHLPGAVFIDLDRDLAGPPGAGGRPPLPAPAAFQSAMRRAGIGAGTAVVAYDDGTGAAARCWWMLRAAGHAAAAVLDGGVAAWLETGGRLTTEEPHPPPGGLTVTVFDGAVATEEVARLVSGAGRNGTPVLDARAPERYRGEVEPVDPRAGPIPGARSLSVADLFPEGRLLVGPALPARIAAAGVGPGDAPVVYCGSGVSACLVLLALAAAGVEGARLYPGSWSEWCRDPARPVAVGPEP